MLEKAPKKDIIFIITDSSYGDDDITCDSAFDSCLRSNQDQVIEVDIISERTATKLKNDSHDKAVETSLESCHEYGLSNIRDKIVTALFNKNTEIVNIYTPYSLVPNDSSTHQDLSESYVSMEKKVLQKSPWDRTIFFDKINKPQDLNGIKELQDLDGIDELQDLSHHDEDFDLELSRREDSNVKKNVVEFCLKSLNAEKDDEDKKKKNAVKIYIDNKPNNLLHFYSEYPDVICVFNDIKMGEEYNKYALDLAIKAANLDSQEEILKIKKTLIKAALEFEELSSNLGERVYNFRESQDSAWKNDYDRDNFQAVKNLLNEEQKQKVDTKFNEAEAKRKLYSVMGKASPISVESSDDVDDSVISLNPGSPRRVGGESAIGTFDWGANYDKEAGASFSFTPLAKNELPLRRHEPHDTLVSRKDNFIMRSNLAERKGGLLPNKPLREAEDSSLRVAAGARSMVGSEPIALNPSQHQKVSATVEDPSGSSVHDQNIGWQSTLFTHLSIESSAKVARQLNFSEKNSDFSVTYENGIIKFKIKSGLEDSGDNPATSSSGVSKFDYNKKPNEEEEKKIINEFNEFNEDKDINNYLSTEYTKEVEKKNILKLLKEASNNTKATFPDANLDDNFFIAVMRVASENRGIANFNNPQAFEQALRKFNPHLDTLKNNLKENTLHQIAKFFSAKFQKFSQDENYFTPRTDSNGKLIDIGRRLFRVCTEENIDAFQTMLTSNKMRNDDTLRTSLESPGLPSPVARSPSSSPTQAIVFQPSRTSSTSSQGAS